MWCVANILSIFGWRYQKRGCKNPNLSIFGEKRKNILSAFGWRYQKRGFLPRFLTGPSHTMTNSFNVSRQHEKATYVRYAAAAMAILSGAAPVFAGRMGAIDLDDYRTPVYTVDGDAFVRHNGDRYANRPLYCNHISAVVLAGDKPYAMVGTGKTMLGNLMFALVRNGQAKWAQNASDITSKYRPGRMEWIVKDAAWGDTSVHIEVAPTAERAGLVAHVRIENAVAGDSLVWASGAALGTRGTVLNDWDFTTPNNLSKLKRGFVTGDCEHNVISLQGSGWSIQAGEKSPTAVGACSAQTKVAVGDASVWENPAKLVASAAKSLPIVCGSIDVARNQDVYCVLKEPDGGGAGISAEKEFEAGMKRVAAIAQQVVVDTPDPWLNAAVGASASATDGVFRNGVYTHAGMRWGVPLLGWRTMYGGTAYGAHENVKTQTLSAVAKQVKKSDRTEARADPATFLSSQAPESRLFGKGRIDFHQPYHYDMQSQFFEQVQHAWRWTGDAELEKLLQGSLPLHCEYIQQCFDPDQLGIYESYCNTWPTDDQWYNGGGTSEETAYAYRAESTALQLAQRAGDQKGATFHAANVARIRKGFFDLLWNTQAGHAGAYREQGGLKRLHDSCWLYAIFCPIDAGLLDPEQAAESLQYTETTLERVKMPYGGEQCWPSNWVPSIWSVRELWPGDNYQLALAYFQTGLPEDGWALLRGTFPQQALFGTVPGDLGHPAGGTDFNDCVSMFDRAVVEGLFGYVPDYTQNVVKIAPEFPSSWDHASIQTPDFTLKFQRSGASCHYGVMLSHAAALHLQIPVTTSGIDAVMVNGAPVKFAVVPGFGRSIVDVAVPSTGAAEIDVRCRDALPTAASIHLAGNAGEAIRIQLDSGSIVDFHDPQQLLVDGKVSDGKLTGVLAANAGDHLLFALGQVGEIKQWTPCKIHITDRQADEALAAKTHIRFSTAAKFDPIPLDSVFNGDIRAIYQQKYLSPRPNTCSLRLAADGYGTWQMVLQKGYKAPEIDLGRVASLTGADGQLVTPDGIAFLRPEDGKNIAFTSRWDNWPKELEIPVNRSGDAICFLLAGTTNPMEVRIPNAELRLAYADGTVEKIEIVPPMNFWTLCPIDGIDYDYRRDGFALPKEPPAVVQLGGNCRANVLAWRLKRGVAVRSVTLETLSEQVVIGVMGVTVVREPEGKPAQ